MSSSILSPTVNTHLFFCSEPQCSNPVNFHNDTCLECECDASTISECPGCGDVTANGYCYDCWQEHFGVDEEPVSWYKPICRECDSAYASDNDYCDDCANIKNKLKTKMTPDQKADWQSLLHNRKYPFRYVCSRCDETFRMAKMAEADTPICGECHLEAVDVVQTWWRTVRKPKSLSPIRIPDSCLECGDLSGSPLCRPCKQMLEETTRYCNRCEGYYNLVLGDAERRECYDCERFDACPDCGDKGATVLGSKYCHECYSNRNHPCNAPPAADGWCTCDGSGRMCDFCAEEYEEPCRGCGVPSQLWTDDTYCRKCFVERYGDEFPPKAPAIMNPENVCEECGIESLTDCDCKLEEREPRGCCGC
jgi:hypothetical protein